MIDKRVNHAIMLKSRHNMYFASIRSVWKYVMLKKAHLLLDVFFLV